MSLEKIPKSDEFVNQYGIFLLYQWRRSVLYLWPTESDITLESTIKWFKNVFIPSDRELYFVLYNEKPVGHVGVKNITPISFEIDNIIKYEACPSSVMRSALLELIKIYSQGGKRTPYLETLKYNDKAMKLYRSLGFVITKEEKVIQERTKVTMELKV